MTAALAPAPLDIDPEEIPGADACAVALVAAARALDEDPARFGEVYAPRRFVFVGFYAVSLFYPLYPKNRLARAMGLGPAWASSMRQVRGARWWRSETGERALRRAREALEAFAG